MTETDGSKLYRLFPVISLSNDRKGLCCLKCDQRLLLSHFISQFFISTDDQNILPRSLLGSLFRYLLLFHNVRSRLASDDRGVCCFVRLPSICTRCGSEGLRLRKFLEQRGAAACSTVALHLGRRRTKKKRNKSN